MPELNLTDFLLLPKLKLERLEHIPDSRTVNFFCLTKGSNIAYCPHCGLETTTVHDRRKVKIKDAPHGAKRKYLIITKRRFRCQGMGCKRVFTENIDGIRHRAKLTERMQRAILYFSNQFANLKGTRKHLRVGTSTLYRRHYSELELKWRERKNDPWPTTIGIDEHSFIKNKERGHREFVTMVVDYNNRRLKEVLPTRISAELQHQLAYIPGREGVKNVCMDLSATYKSFAKNFFPNAKIIADKFHVTRLLSPAITKHLYALKKETKDHRLRRKLILKSAIKLDYKTREMIEEWLKSHDTLRELYYAKETIMKIYRCENAGHAKRILIKLTDALALSKIPELKTLRRTLMDWMDEILNYFENRLTNARTEGYNNVAKQVLKRAYGFKNFNNYRLKLLYACQ